MYKIQTLNNIHDSGLAQLRDIGYEVTDSGELNPDAIIVRSANMHDMAINPELLSIARAGAGVNNIPVERCADCGIVVFNTPGANAEAVKEITICAMLMASRDIIGGIDWVRSVKGTDDIPSQVEAEKSKFAGPEIKGKSLGVLGLGAIGVLVADAAMDLGMKVYGYDPYLTVASALRLSGNIIIANELETIYRNCDYITLHLPYIPETNKFINAAAISKMRDGVRLINIARGELVNDEDILEALKTGKVVKYVTDFPNDVVTGAPGVIAFPHLGASTPESEENCAAMAAAQTIEYLKNGNIINSVNIPNLMLNRTGEGRLCVIHRELPEDVFQDIIKKDGNVSINMKSAYGDGLTYTIIETERKLDEAIGKAVKACEGVIRVRII